MKTSKRGKVKKCASTAKMRRTSKKTRMTSQASLLLTVEDLNQNFIFSENLVLNLKSFQFFEESNQKIQFFIDFFKSRETNDLNSPKEKGHGPLVFDKKPQSKFTRNISFKNIKLWFNNSKQRQNIYYPFRFNLIFSKECGEGIHNLEYRSPEYAEQGIINLGSDLWGLGLVLYEFFYQKPLFSFEQEKVSLEHIRRFISKINIKKSKRSFSRIPKKCLKLFLGLMTHCPFERIMWFQNLEIWELGILSNVRVEQFRGDQFPIKFKYDEDYNYNESDFFLDSVNYRVSSKFKQKLKKRKLKYFDFERENPGPVEQARNEYGLAPGLAKLELHFNKNTETKNISKSTKTKKKKKNKKKVKKRAPSEGKRHVFNKERFKIESKIWKLNSKVRKIKRSVQPSTLPEAPKKKNPRKKIKKKKALPESPDLPNSKGFSHLVDEYGPTNISHFQRSSTTGSRYFSMNNRELYSRFHTNDFRSNTDLD